LGIASDINATEMFRIMLFIMPGGRLVIGIHLAKVKIEKEAIERSHR
jgi:predicted aspartyl protease